jgi:hypothetical protein
MAPPDPGAPSPPVAGAMMLQEGALLSQRTDARANNKVA